MGKPISRSSGVSRCAPQTTIPAKPDTCASSVVKSPMQPSSIRPLLSITKTLPGWLYCIASRKTSTLPKCWTGRASPAIRAPGTTGLMPGGANRNAIFRRSAASATSGVESLPKAAERDCFFTRPENHGIDEKKLEISSSLLERSTLGRSLLYAPSFRIDYQMVRDTGVEPPPASLREALRARSDPNWPGAASNKLDQIQS